MRLLKTDMLRFLATIALLLMLGSASTCRADFQVALTDQQTNDLTVTVSALLANPTELEGPDVVDVITFKEFYFVGDSVNVTVKSGVACLCLVHHWRVRVLNDENRSVFEWNWMAEAGDEGYGEKTLIWIPVEAGKFLILAELMEHGWGSKELVVFDGEYVDRWVWTDKEEYKPGEKVEIFLHNAGNQTLDGYIQLCIARYENGTWFLVYEMHIYVASILLAGQEVWEWTPCNVVNLVWNQTDMEGKPIPMGRYQVVWIPFVNGVPTDLCTCEFKVVSIENPKIYLVVVEKEIYGEVSDEIEEYKDILVDRYGILTYVIAVSRYASAEGVRSYLNRVYNYYLKRGCDFLGAVFIGDLPHVLFEVQNPWAFMLEMNETYKMSFLGREVFPCDLYFEDLDGVWLDSDGNGVLDAHDGDAHPEIFIGRISPNTILRSNKINYIKRYLSKELTYLREETSSPSKALVYIDDDWEPWAQYWAEACSRAFNETTLVYEGWKTNAWNYAWRLGDGWNESCLVHVAVHGSPHVHAFGPRGTGIQGLLTSLDISSINPKPLFYLLFSCSNARYTSKWYIAGQYIWGDSGLLSISSTKAGGMLFYDRFYEPLGEGCCFGESLKRWFTWVLSNNPMGESGTKAWFYGMTVIGDPVLALKPSLVSKIVNITALYEECSPLTAEMFELKPFFEFEAQNIIEVFQGSANSTYITLATNQSWCYVELEIVDVPSGIEVEVYPQSVNLTTNADVQISVTVNASQDLKPGVYDLTILARGNSTVKEETLSIMVAADTTPPFIDITAIDGNIATIQTVLGTINGTIILIEGDVATIETSMGTIKMVLEGWTGGTTSPITTPEGTFQILILTTSTLEGQVAFPDNVVAINLSGPSGTTGTTNVVIPKQLLIDAESSIEKVVVTIDNERVNFTYTEQPEAYVLQIIYTHSTHAIKVYLTGLPPTPFPAWIIAILALIAAATTGVTVYLLKIRKPRIAHESPLKVYSVIR